MKIFNRALLIGGEQMKVGTPVVTIVDADKDGNVTRAYGASVPTDADRGYAKGCIFIATGGGVGTTLYVNEGSASSADFNLVASAGGSGVATWDQLIALDTTLDLGSGASLTIDRSVSGSNDVLTLTNSGGGSGSVLQITNVGTGADIRGSSGNWSVSKAGAATFASQTISGTAGSNIFTVTAGDLVVSDGSLTMVDADNAATLSITNDTATSASVFVFAGSGAFTGSTTTSFMTITPSGLTTGTAVYLPVAALTTGKAVHVVGNAVTSGILVHIASSAASTQLTGNGRLFKVDHTGNATGTGILSEFNSAAADETVIVKITASAALALGVMLQLSGASVTTGKGIEVADLNALTTGIGLHLASSATAIATTGRLLYVNHTGATSTSGIMSEFASAANDETVIVKITASDALALGTALQVVGNSITTGNGITVAVNALTDGFGISVTSSNTTLSSTGRLLNVSHTGNAGVSAVIAEVKSAAADETVVFQVLASAALAAGKVVNISGASVTTGTLLSVADGNALTTGALANFTSNSADATARTLVTIKNDHASATGAVPLQITNDAPTNTNFFLAFKLNGVSFYVGNGTTSPNTVVSGTAGDVAFGCDSGKSYYCTGTTNWTAFA